jgi:hypothetical protein
VKIGRIGGRRERGGQAPGNQDERRQRSEEWHRPA